ncbi:MAG TPA: amidohydrolase family protein [Spirochaetota bacterium]|nr:amidohydrolase family protein [Spirochaetota bacterium]HPU90220.1 amidohydrolase family protein [Spirochaetota bacterium]
MPSLPSRIVDFHVHLFPDRLFESIWRHFVTDYGWSVIHQLYYRECVAYLRERGVGPIVYSNYAHRPGIARGLNAWNRAVVDELPDLYCLAAYHPGDDDAFDYAREALAHPKVLGIKLQLLVQRFYPHDERLFPLYELIMERGKRVLLHTGTGPVGNEFVGAAHFERLMRRYPELPVTVAHMGALEYAAFVDFLDAFPNMYLDTAFVFLPQFDGYCDLDAALLEKYRDRILYGSDFPNLIMPREDEIEHLLGLGLSQEFYDAVFYNNGMRLIRGISRMGDV